MGSPNLTSRGEGSSDHSESVAAQMTYISDDSRIHPLDDPIVVPTVHGSPSRFPFFTSLLESYGPHLAQKIICPPDKT